MAHCDDDGKRGAGLSRLPGRCTGSSVTMESASGFRHIGRGFMMKQLQRRGCGQSSGARGRSLHLPLHGKPVLHLGVGITAALPVSENRIVNCDGSP